MGAEVGTGKLKQVRHNNSGVLPSTSHDKHPWEDFAQSQEVDNGIGGRDTYKVSFPRVLT